MKMRTVCIVIAIAINQSVTVKAQSATEVYEEISEIYGNQSRRSTLQTVGDSLLQIAIADVGQNDTLVALILHKLGSSFYRTNKETARSYWLRALEVWDRAPQANQNDAAKTISNLGKISQELGDIGIARNYYERMLRMRIDTYGEMSLEAGKAYERLTRFHYSQSELDESLVYSDMAYRAYMASAGPSNATWNALSLKAEVLRDLRRIDEALEIAKLALAGFKQIGERQYYGNSLILAHIRTLAGELEQAESDYVEFFEYHHSHEESTDGWHIASYTGHNRLGLLYLKQSRFDEAMVHFRTALDYGKRLWPENSEKVIRTSINFSDAASRGGHHQLSDSSSRHIVSVIEGKEALADNFEVARAYHARAMSRRVNGDFPGALADIAMAFDHYYGLYRKSATVLSEADAVKYTIPMDRSEVFGISTALEWGLGKAPVRDLALVMMASKANSFDLAVARHKALATVESHKVDTLAGQLRQTRFDLFATQLSMAGDDDSTTSTVAIDSLLKEADRLDNSIARQCNHLVRFEDSTGLKLEQITAALPANTVLVDYYATSYAPVKSALLPDSSHILSAGHVHYVAVLIKPDGHIKLFDLGPAKPLHRLIDSVSACMNTMAERSRGATVTDFEAYHPLSRRLYDAILAPMMAECTDLDMVLVSPDGHIHDVPFSALIDSTGRFLVERAAVHYLPTARLVAKKRVTETNGTGLLLVGDPKFGETVSGSKQSETTYPDADSPPLVTLRDAITQCFFQDKILATPLPHTGRELDTIEKTWRARSDDRVVVLRDLDASETIFKRQVPGTRVVHIATHGVNLLEVCPGLLGEKDKRGITALHHNPMLWTGLLLAGVDERLGTDLHDDGFLSADEVAMLTLDGVELVVLSACQTGRGYMQGGEGVWGLRRAFQVAGARSVVASLWPVDDRTTMESMQHIYSDLSIPLPERIRGMQLKQINKLREQGLVPHPFHWAAFISSGDWK